MTARVRAPENTEASKLTTEEAAMLAKSTEKAKEALSEKEVVEDVVMGTEGEVGRAAENGVQVEDLPTIPDAPTTKNFREILLGLERKKELDCRLRKEKSPVEDPIVCYEKDGHPAGKIPEKRKEKLSLQWRDCLIIKLLGCSPGWRTMFDRTSKLWKPKADYDLIPLPNGYYAARFESFDDYRHVLEEGPWMIFGFYLTVRPWIPGFRPNTDTILKTLVWIRFPELALDYFEENVLLEFASMIGKPVKVDVSTRMASKGNFARVCVEVDLSKPLVAKIWWDDYWQPVAYEGLHLICFVCGRAGHRDKECCFRKQVETSPGEMAMTPASQVASIQAGFGVGVGQIDTVSDKDGSGFGAWMVVPRRGAKKTLTSYKGRSSTSQKVHEEPITGSRFAALEVENEVGRSDEVLTGSIINQGQKVSETVSVPIEPTRVGTGVSTKKNCVGPKVKSNGPRGFGQSSKIQFNNRSPALGVKNPQISKPIHAKDKSSLALSSGMSEKQIEIFDLNRAPMGGLEAGVERPRDGRNLAWRGEGTKIGGQMSGVFQEASTSKTDKTDINSIEPASIMTEAGLGRPPDGSPLPLEEVFRRIGATLSKEHQSVLGFGISDADKTRFSSSHSSIWSSEREREMEETKSRFQRICVFCGSSSGKKASYQEAAIELGNEMVERRIDLVYGGGSVGLMGLVSQAVHDGGRHVLGIIPRTLMPKEITGDTVGEVKAVSNMHQRKAEMARQADAFIALPGGYGTLEELLEVITWAQLGIHRKPVGLLNVDGYYNSLLSFIDKAVDEGFVSPTARRIIVYAPTAKELVRKLEDYVPEYDEVTSKLVWEEVERLSLVPESGVATG